MRAGMGLMWDGFIRGGRGRGQARRGFARGVKKHIDFIVLGSRGEFVFREQTRGFWCYKTALEPGRFTVLRSSSSDLHPTSGGRFVFEQMREEPTHYDVGVYLPAGVELHGKIRFAEDGESTIEIETDDPWVREQVEKLVRVLRRTKQQRIVRWRPQE